MVVSWVIKISFFNGPAWMNLKFMYSTWFSKQRVDRLPFPQGRRQVRPTGGRRHFLFSHRSTGRGGALGVDRRHMSGMALLRTYLFPLLAGKKYVFLLVFLKNTVDLSYCDSLPRALDPKMIPKLYTFATQKNIHLKWIPKKFETLWDQCRSQNLSRSQPHLCYSIDYRYQKLGLSKEKFILTRKYTSDFIEFPAKSVMKMLLA